MAYSQKSSFFFPPKSVLFWGIDFYGFVGLWDHLRSKELEILSHIRSPQLSRCPESHWVQRGVRIPPLRLPFSIIVFIFQKAPSTHFSIFWWSRNAYLHVKKNQVNRLINLGEFCYTNVPCPGQFWVENEIQNDIGWDGPDLVARDTLLIPFFDKWLAILRRQSALRPT